MNYKCKKYLHKFDNDKQREYELYLNNCLKMEHDNNTKKILSNLRHDKFLENSAEIPQSLAEALRNKLIPCNYKVQGLIDEHYRSLSEAWTLERCGYIGLSKMYYHHKDFKNFFDKFEPELAGFIAQAMEVYAESRL